MEFESRKEKMLDALRTISGAVASKSTLPILMNIIIEANDGKLHFVATDLDISIETSIETNVIEEGSCTIPAKKLRGLVNEFPSKDTTLHFSIKNESTANIEVQETSSEFQIPVLDREEYPSLPEVEDGVEFSLSVDSLRNVLEHSTFAAGTDTSRSYLCGVYFDLDPDELTVVATDAHRLALHKVDEINSNGNNLAILVPTEASKELTKILRDHEDEDIKINTDEQLVEFEVDDTRMVSRLIDEDFPNYQQVIPDDYERRIEVNRDRVLDAVKRVSLMADEKTRRLLLHVDPSKLTVEAESSEEGGGEEVIEVDYNGESQTIAFNGDYLQDVLSHIEEETINFDLISEDSPGTFRPMEGDDYLYIIMPLRLN